MKCDMPKAEKRLDNISVFFECVYYDNNGEATNTRQFSRTLPESQSFDPEVTTYD